MTQSTATQPAPPHLPIRETPHRLAAPPARLVGADGIPIAGTWAGGVADARFEGLAKPYARSFVERRLVEKKWQYVLLALPDAMLSLAILDLGYLSSGICAVFDRGARRLLYDDNPVLPPGLAQVADTPGPAFSARLSGPGVRASMERNGDRLEVAAQWGRVRVALSLDVAAGLPPVSVLSPLSPGRFNFTEKQVCIPATGEVRIGNVVFDARRGSAGLDFTHGFLERETAWRWAFATGVSAGRRVGFNLTEGFNDAGLGENVVWIDGAPAAVGPVHFQFDATDRAAPWVLRADGGALELRFHPEGQRTQDTDLKLVASRYVQPFGAFDGFITSAAGERLELHGLPGVTEDHVARW